MTKKSDPHTRLLAETFADDWESGPAGAFARQAAAHARWRHCVRRALVPASAIAAALALGAVLFFSRASGPISLPTAPRDSALAQTTSPSPTAETASAVASRSVETAPVTKISPAFEIISDEQLIAELRDRPLLILPQESARPKLVVLER